MNITNKKGIMWMILAAFTLSCMGVVINYMQNIHSFAIFSIASLLTGVISFIIILVQNKKIYFKNIRNYFMRSVFGSLSMVMWFHTVKIIPIIEATSISFLTPLFNSLFAIFLLKEKFSPKNSAFLLLGFLGAIIMLKPIFIDISWKHGLAFFTVFIWVITDLLTKVEATRDDAIIQCFFISIFTFIICLPFAIYMWKPTSNGELFYFIPLSILQLLNLFSIIKAYSYADLNILVPFDFTRLIFTSVLAYFLLNEAIYIHSFIGAAIILFSTILISKLSVKI